MSLSGSQLAALPLVKWPLFYCMWKFTKDLKREHNFLFPLVSPCYFPALWCSHGWELLAGCSALSLISTTLTPNIKCDGMASICYFTTNIIEIDVWPAADKSVIPITGVALGHYFHDLHLQKALHQVLQRAKGLSAFITETQERKWQKTHVKT